MWNEQSIKELVQSQKDFFASGVTLDIKWRKKQLKALKNAVISHEKEIAQALYEDLGRSEEEAYFCDIGMVILEINETLKHLSSWAKPEKHFSGLAAFPSTKTKVYKMPYGVSLIISPFNFPFLLSLGILNAALSGGNTAIIKASSKSKASTAVLQKIIEETFPKEYVAVVDGGHDIADLCLSERFDKIFYTGSPRIGSHVMEMASKNLTPVTLELGGENGNWCIVRKDANIKDAARKIAFFKICNSGQICININQVAVAKEVALPFIEELKKEIVRQIGEHPLENEEYPHLIGKSAFDKCQQEAELYKNRIVFGGHGDEKSLKFEPTLIYPVDHQEEIANHELFNPLLPIVPFEDDKVDDLLKIIASREHGLAFYLFTKDIKWAEKVMSSQQYGGGCINEVCIHLAVEGVPFGGVGRSGMGCYHGEWGFKDFTHPSTVLFGKTRMNLSLREHPYHDEKGKRKMNFIKKFLK